VSNLADWVVQVLDHIVPARRGLVVLHSTPDIDDMAVALLTTQPSGVTTVILADSPRKARQRLLDLDLPGLRVLGKRAPRGIWIYLRSHRSVSTHGLFGSRRRGRGKLSATPWHGELSKPIGIFVGRPPRHFDRIAVSNQNSKILRVAEFQVSPASVHVIGTPRQSTLLQSPRCARVSQLKGTQKWVLFVPTYRQPTHGPMVGVFELTQDDLNAELAGLDEMVRNEDAVLWVRPHPLTNPGTLAMPHARLATDDVLQQSGVTFYDVLAATDVMITDYSSVWVDFLLLDKPVVGFCPDIERYRASRGLALEPYENWFPGPVVTGRDGLFSEVRDALAGRDAHAERRGFLASILMEPRPNAAHDFWSTLDIETSRIRSERV
jgi:CDP-glycerol glycerophosphotransferase